MEKKFLEIRDRGTWIPVLAFRFDLADTEMPGFRESFWRAGFGKGPEDWYRYTFVMRFEGPSVVNYDPLEWGGSSRTMWHAHRIIEETWDQLQSGDVVDVEFSLGEKPTKKTPEWKETF
jgi:hypothetical protein